MRVDYKYEYIEHTADIGLKASGNTLAGAYAATAAGMFSIMIEPETVKETEERRICVHADDPESLLFEWLNELLYYVDAQSLIFSRFDVTELSDTDLVAVCHGEVYDPGRHEMKNLVKSATYHLMEVDRKENRIQVIFDV